MSAQRIGVRALLVLVAGILQVVVVNRIPLPGGHPDVLLLVVIAFALVSGSESGAILGFCAGLFADVLPPAGHIAGRVAFAYTLVGYVVGLLADSEEDSALRTVVAVIGGSAISVLVYAAIGGLLGDARVNAEVTIQLLVATVVYDVVLAPFVVRPISALARRFEPVRTR